ncbi:TPA: hypothetical protein ACH3X1_014748 [Trebouxia sp. C0004]
MKADNLWPYLQPVRHRPTQASNTKETLNSKSPPSAAGPIATGPFNHAQAAMDMPAVSYSMTETADMAGWLDSDLQGVLQGLRALFLHFRLQTGQVTCRTPAIPPAYFCLQIFPPAPYPECV